MPDQSEFVKKKPFALRICKFYINRGRGRGLLFSAEKTFCVFVWIRFLNPQQAELQYNCAQEQASP